MWSESDGWMHRALLMLEAMHPQSAALQPRQEVRNERERERERERESCSGASAGMGDVSARNGSYHDL